MEVRGIEEKQELLGKRSMLELEENNERLIMKENFRKDEDFLWMLWRYSAQKGKPFVSIKSRKGMQEFSEWRLEFLNLCETDRLLMKKIVLLYKILLERRRKNMNSNSTVMRYNRLIDMYTNPSKVFNSMPKDSSMHASPGKIRDNRILNRLINEYSSQDRNQVEIQSIDQIKQQSIPAISLSSVEFFDQA